MRNNFRPLSYEEQARLDGLRELQEEREKREAEVSHYVNNGTPRWDEIVPLLKEGRTKIYEDILWALRKEGKLVSFEKNPWVLITQPTRKILDISKIANVGFKNREDAEAYAKARGLGKLVRYSEFSKTERKMPPY